MRIDEYITSLRKNKNIIITFHNDELKVKASKEALTKDILDELKAKKADIIEFFKSINANNKVVTIPQVDKKDYYKLSNKQKSLFFLNELDKTSLAYNLSQVFKFEGELNISKLNNAFNKVINRHESLRTFFTIINDEPVQVILDKVNFEIERFNSNENEVQSIIDNFITPFNLDVAPLIKVGLVKMSPLEHLLLVDMHHIITDGTSQSILMNDLMVSYNDEELPELTYQYKNYCEWQQTNEIQEKIEKQREFWLNGFLDIPETLKLPTDFDRSLIKKYEGNSVSFNIDIETTNKLKLIGESEECTMFMVILSIYYVLCNKLSHQEDIVIGTPVAGRQHADLEDIIGMFVNTLPLRNFPKKELSFREFLTTLKSKTLDCFNNQFYPYEELIRDLKVSRDASHNPLFDIMFAFYNFETPEFKIPDLLLKDFNQSHNASKFDITLYAYEADEQILLRFEYSTELYREETIKRFIKYFKQIISVISTNPQTKIQDIEILTKEEKEQILYEFNNTETYYPKDKTIIELFEEQVRKTPENKALIFDDKKQTYKELNDISNKIASYLINEGAQANDMIGVILEREEFLMPSIFGVLKAGCTYIPIDPKYPSDRINTIIKDSQLKIILTDSKYKFSLQKADIQKIELDKNFEKINSLSVKNLPHNIVSSDLAYIIYTSGSTGKPKGVMIEHHSVINRILWMQKMYPIEEKDVLIQKTPVVFDVSVWELFWWSFTGASLCLLKPTGENDPFEIISTIKQNKVTTIHFVPSMLNAFLSVIVDEFDFTALDSLKYVFASGEALMPEQVKIFAKSVYKHCETRLINLYGPTEATVDVSYFECDLDNKNDIIPIGKPIDNTSLYILNEYLKLTPIGVAGELYIAGVGLARGYLHNEELTNEKFITNPYNKNDRLYSTGDLACWLPDGNIEYLGRIDNQVKVRGFRIELGEIENRLSRYTHVRECAVLAKEKSGEKYLVAYYLSEEEIEKDKLKSFLSETLPHYMVPSIYVRLDVMPLTSNGKLNRKALPDPEITIDEKYIAPKTKEEKLLVEAWSKALGVKNIGIEDNFFSLGGDSIKSIQISSRIRSAGYEVSVKEILTNQTIKKLSTKLKETVIVSDQSEVLGEVSMSPIQQWFFNNSIENKHHFNQSVMLKFTEELSKDKLKSIFKKLQEHHDALRMVFQKEGNTIDQKNMGIEFPVFIEEHDFNAEQDQKYLLLKESNKIQSSIDLENGPLLKIGLFHMQGGSHLLIVIHHLVVDGFSWRILFEDIETLYKQIKNNKQLSLPLKTDSFQSWSNHFVEYTKSKTFQKSKHYWESILDKEFNQIARDFPKGDNILKDNKKETFCLSKEQTTKLLTKVHSSFKTQINDILLTALLLGINNKYGNDIIRIDLEGHGREDIKEGINISRTVGWFTSIYPVLLSKQEGELSRIIKEVKETLRRIPNNGIDYLIQKHSTSQNSTKDKNSEIQSQILFNYLGQFDHDIENNLFTIADESAGNTVSNSEKGQYDWDISGIVIKGQLELSLTYSKAQYNSETISTLMDFYKENLIEIIDYCSAYGKNELSPSDLIYKELSIGQLDKLQQKYEIKDIYLLSPMQEGMLFHSLLDSDAGHYFEQMKWEMRGDLNLIAVEKSINDIMHRYDILRTVFLHEGFERPIQIVLKERKIDFVYEDIQDEILQSSKEEVILSYQMNDRSKKFELSKDVLMRLSVLKTAEAEYVFIWSYHHILMDGWCMGIIVNEFREIYSQNRKDQKVTLLPVNPYSSYIKWLDDRDKEVSIKYWQNYLESYESLTTLPKKEILPSENITSKIVSKQLIIDRKQTQLINKVSRECSVTTNTIIQGAWGILLSKYNNVSDVVFGSVVSGRPADIEGIETMVGLFINTIPVRLSYSGEDTFGDLLKQVQSRAFESEQHQYSPLSEIQSLSELGRGLLDHILVFENYPISNEIEKNEASNYEDFTVANVNIHEQTNYDLTLIIIPEEEILIKIDYNEEVYNHETIENISEQLKKIINQIIANSETLVSSIEIISEKEKSQILYDFNNTKEEYSTDTLMTELFEEQVKLSPNNVAIIANNKSYSYEWLNTVTNQLANLLREKGLQRESSVVVIMDRDIELIVTLLGILKSGGKYVPIEPYIPMNRKKSIFKSVNVEYIITNKKYQSDINNLQEGISSINNIFSIDFKEPQILEFNEISKKGYSEINISSYSNLDLERINSSEDLAYVIFTSGSSGEPKGVAVQHKPVINLIEWVNKTYNITAQDKVLLVSSVSFDLSVYDIFGFLAVGAAIRIANKEDLEEPDELANIIVEEGITFWDSAPAMLQQVIPFLENRKQEAAEKGVLRLCFLSGDWIPLTMPPIMKDLFKDLQFIALGGATEATVWSNFYEVGDIDEKWKSIPYGKPMQNAKYFVLDKERNLCPIGFVGDLYIGGQCLAKEYINDKELSDRKFIPSPFDKGGMLYDTGDMAKWFPDGNIEFLGRKDSQIKIRGYRIELGEIESRLLKLKGMDQVLAQVISKSKYDKFICMYYVSKSKIDENVLRDFLSDDLPDFMLPKYIIHLKDMPMSKNGKVDRKQLPSPDSLIDKDKIEKPKTGTEKKLIQIWSNILHIDENRIGINEDFFQLGGHSILAVHLISAIQQKFSVNLKLRKIFEYTTIEKLSVLIESAESSNAKDINKIEKKYYYSASPAQQRLYYEQLLNKDNLAYNIHNVYEIKKEVDLDKLKQSFQYLINRHESLRTSFSLFDDGVAQKINENVNFELTILHKNDHESLKDILVDFIRPFDLNMKSLMRCAIIKQKEKSDLLVVDIHHIVCDGISLNILMNEFIKIYQEVKLMPIEFNYIDYVFWQKKNNIENQKQFWLKKLSGELPNLDLPVIQDRDSVDIYPASIISLEIDKQYYKKIKKFTADSNVSDYMFLLSIFYIFLSKITGKTDIIIGTDVAGRSKTELKNIVGTFINLLPLRLKIQQESTYNYFLKEVKECVLESFDNQDFQINQIISILKQEKKLSGNLFDVHFAFSNYIDNNIELDKEDFTPFEIKGNPTTQHEFKIDVFELNNKFNVRFIYSNELFDNEIIELFKNYYFTILTTVLENTTINIESIELENSVIAD